jgi:hypothetical protein
MPLKTVNYRKGEHHYAFRYAPGREGEVIDHVMRLAGDAESAIDWLDAALVSFRVAREAATPAADDIEQQELV